MSQPPASDAGYTFIELLVAASLMLSLSALTFGILADTKTVFSVAADRGEVQQRARAGLATVSTALRGAGMGPDRGAAVGPLVRWLPPIWPGRPGGSAGDLSSAVTTLEALDTVPAAILARDAPAGTATLEFDRSPGCALPCGFFDRMRVVVLDRRGDFDVFVLTETDGTWATAYRLLGGTGASYGRGSLVIPVEMRTYYLNARSRELRSFDGDRSDLPVVNDVVDLAFEYLGDPQTPAEPRPPLGEENCLYDTAGAPRTLLPSLPASEGTLATMGTAILTDGPWCGAGTEPFDADLFRIRAVRVTLRLQASSPARRGSDRRWFRNPGTASAAKQMVRDFTVRTTVTPPNLGGWR